MCYQKYSVGESVSCTSLFDGQTHLEPSTVTLAAHACRGLISNQNISLSNEVRHSRCTEDVQFYSTVVRAILKVMVQHCSCINL